ACRKGRGSAPRWRRRRRPGLRPIFRATKRRSKRLRTRRPSNGAGRLACGGVPHYICNAMNAVRRPADIARRSARALAARKAPRDSSRRETSALPRAAAREKARELFRRYPKAAYMTEIESWRVLPGDRIEFTVRRLPSAD